MISSTARLVSTSMSRPSVVPRAFATLGSTRSMTTQDKFGKKEKVEEDKYIRAHEEELKEAKAKAEAKEKAEAEAKEKKK